VSAVLIALADVGPGVQLEELLNQAGARAKWDAQHADGPASAEGVAGASTAKVVLVDADHLGARLPDICDRWREQPSVPGVVAIGSSSVARAQAPRARVTLVAPTAKVSTLVAAIREAATHRLAAGMRWPVLRAAAGLPPCEDTPAAWPLTLEAARRVDLEVPRVALRWHALHYATPTARLDQLREERLLTVPELAAAARLDGALTVKRLVAAGPLDPQATARFLWMLGSIGALDFTPEVRDIASPQRRMLHDVRAHLRARSQRLEKSTFYDVLEITPLAEYPEIEDGYQRVAQRYSPDVLAQHDLAELANLIGPMWELVEKARAVLVDHAQRGRYHDWLRGKLPSLRTVWAIDPPAAKAAAEAFARGQRSLGEGDAHKAMKDLAFACRHHPGHPEYEANLAWARFRVQVASGRDQVEAATAERALLEDLLLGRRVWPKALVALALLCASAGDADAARWHLFVALRADPTLPAAQQLAQRLGMRR